MIYAENIIVKLWGQRVGALIKFTPFGLDDAGEKEFQFYQKALKRIREVLT